MQHSPLKRKEVICGELCVNTSQASSKLQRPLPDNNLHSRKESGNISSLHKVWVLPTFAHDERKNLRHTSMSCRWQERIRFVTNTLYVKHISFFNRKIAPFLHVSLKKISMIERESQVQRYIFIFYSCLLRFVTRVLRCISRSMSCVFQHVQGHLRKSVSPLFTWITHITSRFISCSNVCAVIIYNNFL